MSERSRQAHRSVGAWQALRRTAQVAGLVLIAVAVLVSGASATVNPKHRSDYVNGVNAYQGQFKKYDTTLAGAEKAVYGFAKGCKQMQGNPSEKAALDALQKDAKELSNAITSNLHTVIANDQNAITTFAGKARAWFSEPADLIDLTAGTTDLRLAFHNVDLALGEIDSMTDSVARGDCEKGVNVHGSVEAGYVERAKEWDTDAMAKLNPLG